MREGHSLILINDWVLSELDSPLFPALMDINMMALVSGMERSVKQWHALLDSVGLKIVRIWSKGSETESLIEAALA